MLEGLEGIIQQIYTNMTGTDSAREQAYKLSREVVRSASATIKHCHRGENDQAHALLAETGRLTAEMITSVASTPALRHTGFVIDSEKEYAEAAITLAAILGGAVPGPDELGIDATAWINGLSEVVGEMRRHVLDLIRAGRARDAEAYLALMEDIYYHTMSFDFPNAVTAGLRNRTDAARGAIERTRGDLTLALQQAELATRLDELKARE